MINTILGDTTHSFVTLVQQYHDAHLLDQEFTRRRRLYRARIEGGKVRDTALGKAAGGEKPAFLPSDLARGLESDIILGKVAPEPIYAQALGVQYGFTGDALREFLNAGGQYYQHCAIKSSQTVPTPPPAPPEDETLFEALAAILKTVRVAHRGEILRPGDPKYNSPTLRERTAAPKLRLIFVGHHAAHHEDLIRNHQDAMSCRMNFDMADVYRKMLSMINKKIGVVDPMSSLLTDAEMGKLQELLHLTDEELLRVKLAQDNHRKEIENYTTPEVIRRSIEYLVDDFIRGSEGSYTEPTAAYEILLNLLQLNHKTVGTSDIKKDWVILNDQKAERDARIVALDSILTLIHANELPQAGALRARLEDEIMTGKAQQLLGGVATSAMKRVTDTRIKVSKGGWVEDINSPPPDSQGQPDF